MKARHAFGGTEFKPQYHQKKKEIERWMVWIYVNTRDKREYGLLRDPHMVKCC
jgi:hypothetical protein